MDAEKGSTVPRYNVITGIAKTLRILEICLALLLLSWFLTRLPFALRLSAAFLRSPLFVFAISNAIIAALLAQSGRLTTAHAHADADDTTTDGGPLPFPSQTNSASLSPVAVTEEVESQKNLITDLAEGETCTDKDSGAGTDSSFREGYRRSQSEKFEEGKKTARRKLRRLETERTRYPEDRLSNEEFQRTIEVFIAKQMRLLKEESLAILVQEPTNKISN